MPENPITDLKWYAANGVDLAVEDEPIDQFAASKPPARPASVPVAPVLSAAPALGNEPETVREAEELAAGAENLDALRERFDRFSGCPLKLRATQLVFADGNPEGRVMFIGEAPGADEDIQGKPFVGRAGRLLDRMLAAIDLDRSKVYIANTVPWRPPGNRNPTDQEIAPCLPFLKRQVELAQPEIIVTLGLVATRVVFDDPKLTISRTRGQWRDLQFGSWTGPAMATLHPAFLLRQPLQKREVWKDMLALQERLEPL
ncbi:MAG: uracil-DNA glycosylase [Hyphomicrobiaceae bacterium]|nr:uracil-DNA glycosylase [Hyphomicrobiaceae bacterium]MCC0023060.1 uracil-DNA glycosylase [Hyphomicrobiaceae bacterium]